MQPNTTYYANNFEEKKEEKLGVFTAKSYSRNMGLKISRLP